MWYLTDQLRYEGRDYEAEEILRPAITQIIEQPQAHIFCEKLIQQMVQVLLRQGKTEAVAQALHNVHTAYELHGLKWNSEQNRILLRREQVRRSEWSSLYEYYEQEISRMVQARKELEDMINLWQQSHHMSDSQRVQLVQYCARVQLEELRTPYCNSLYSAAVLASKIGRFESAKTLLETIIENIMEVGKIRNMTWYIVDKTQQRDVTVNLKRIQNHKRREIEASYLSDSLNSQLIHSTEFTTCSSRCT
jgi:hypothetical protein